MNEGWSRSYSVILLLAMFLLPTGTFVVAVTTQSAAYVLGEINAELPSSTKFFVGLGHSGMAVIGGASLLAMLCLGIKKDRFLGTCVSAILLAVTMAFFFAAVLASHIPFVTITWRLAP